MNNELNNILNNPDLKKNPFSLPEGYIAKMEDGVREKISARSRTTSSWSVLKPAFALACSFLLIFGIGYSVLHLTSTLSHTSDSEGIIADVTESYYGFDDLFSDDNDDSSEEIEMEKMDEDMEEIITYLGSELSAYELSNIYANLLE